MIQKDIIVAIRGSIHILLAFVIVAG